MDNDRFNPVRPEPEPPVNRSKDPFREPPIKDYSHLLRGEPPKQLKAHRRTRKVILGIIVIGVVGTAGFIGYTKFWHQTSKPKATTQTATKTAAANKQVATTSYSSSNFGVSLKYPKDWAVTNDTATSLTVTSPAMSLVSDSGQTVQGKAVLIVTPQGQLPAAFGSSDAIAVLNSQQIKYDQPTTAQLAQTYVSFVQYNSATLTGELDGIYITGNNGYQKDQTVPRVDIANLNPLATITFGQCSGTNCSAPQNLSIKSSDWSNPALSTPILNIIKSLAFS